MDKTMREIFKKHRTYTFKEFEIPGYMMDSLLAYIHERRPVGGFLQRIIENDLVHACAQADDNNIRNLPAYAAYLYHEAPSNCWGSAKAYWDWLGRKENNADT